MKIKNIVFDIGNVIIKYTPEHIIDQVLPDTPFKDAFLEHLFHHENWQLLDRGDISMEEAADFVAEQIGEEVHSDVHSLIQEFVYHTPIIEGSKKIFNWFIDNNYPVYILSNFQDEPFDTLLEEHEFLQNATGVVVSARHNMMKPEPEIYQHLLDHFVLDPNETIFFDDLEENIEAANAAGMNGIVFQSPEQLKADLAEYNITVS
jgi:FMN phosphatase YigB (HAD superfamily)